jgi:hypothetical protein
MWARQKQWSVNLKKEDHLEELVGDGRVAYKKVQHSF